MVLSAAVVVVPKQYGMLLMVVMSCPLLLARQQFPKVPASLTLHSFCSVALSATRSSPAAQARTAARRRKEEREKESLIFLFEEKGREELGENGDSHSTEN